MPKTREEICAALAQDLMDLFESIAQAQSPQAPATRLYSFDDLAEMLGKSICTVRQWGAAGEFGELVRVGNSLRVTQEGLDKFIRDHSGPPKKRTSRKQPRAVRNMTNPKGQPLGI